MSYAQYGKVEAADYNTFVGNYSTASSATNTLNTVYGIGSGRSGYGQAFVSGTISGLPQVSVGSSVTYDNWANLINVNTNLATHQNTTLTSVTPPVAGATIAYLSAISTNLTSIYTNRNNAVAQAGTTTTTSTVSTNWSSAITFTHTVTFESADKARYFFNAGGQIKLQFTQTSGTAINTLLNALAQACGTIVLSAVNSGTQTIAGVSYTGVTKRGGSGTVNTLTSNAGYYGLTTSDQLLFKQFASGSPAGYIGTFISVSARTNGTQGVNSDNGSVITITTVWDMVPNGAPTFIATPSTTRVDVVYPSSTYLTNTWGAVSLSGVVSGT
jgi:hypothetical protein